MKTLALAASLFFALPTVSALGDLGFSLGVKDNNGNCKYSPDYESDMDKLSAYTQTVRVYAVSDCNTLQYLGPALESKGFSAFLGIWPNDDAHFQDEKNALSTYLPTLSVSNIKGFTVGSEALYRGDMSATDLASKISDVKSFLKDIKDKDGNSYGDLPVGTADSWNVLVDDGNKPAIEASDVVFANAFSYWQGQTQANASFSFVDDIMQALQKIQEAKGSTDISFWIGETGWPTDGGSFEDSQPSVENAANFWQEAICAIRGWGINTFVFEAFDEAWKPETSGIEGVEKYWGVYDSNGNLKYDLSCKF